ncbi:Hypothetical protein PHPALM_19748 [Phytophthora palmivora]|uniref:ZSWIM1/3 RNaseH-like domain-containing protein n=1 Tax=Phytophthora palmivora TaxID=4796 RepID=A0A2P4XGM1_9STRA|nr:Hypothetical protein PHPALM_19748 [Phytophthora palmivora]
MADFDARWHNLHQGDTCKENTYKSNRVEHVSSDHYPNQQGMASESELFLDETFPYNLVSYACTHSGRHTSRELATVKVLLVDATHDNNSEWYKMFSFMVHDSHGRGQHVQHTLMTDERVGSMRLAILQFKRTGLVKLRTDWIQFSVNARSRSRVLLLEPSQRMNRSSVSATKSKSWKRRMAKYPYFGLISWIIDILAGRWEMWSSFLRDNVAHLGNSTNNRLEASWQKIKTIVDRDVDLDEAVTSLIWWARYKEKQFITILCRVGRVVDMVQHTNPELAQLAQIVSKHAYDIIEEQFKVAVSTKT